MKRLCCVILACSLLLCMAPPVFAVEIPASQQNVPLAREIYEEAGHLSYYEHDSTRTINAVVIANTVDFSFAYTTNNRTTVYHSVIAYDDFITDVSQLQDLSVWSEMCAAAFATGEVVLSETEQSYVDQEQATPNLFSVQPRINTNGVLTNKLIALVGAGYSNKFIANGGTNTISVNVYQTHDLSVRYAEQQVCPKGERLQVVASLIGIKYTVLGAVLGLVFDQRIPSDTSVSLYDCVVNDIRQGKIAGTAYYTTGHETVYRGIDNADDSTYQPQLDTTPFTELYTPSSSVYNSTSEIITRTLNAY